MSRRAAFFDMDRTLVPVNTGIRYARWRVRRGELRRTELARILAWSAKYSLGLLDADAVSRFAARTMVGVDEARFREECARWVDEEIVPLIGERARSRVEGHRTRGDVLVVLSGSTRYSVEPVARALGVEHVLASGLEVAGGRFTGEVTQPLAFAQGKVELAVRFAAEHDVSLQASTFYTDSISDLPMLERVGTPVIVNPDARLRATALRRRWPIERW